MRAIFLICGVMLLMTVTVFADEVREYRLDNGLLVLLKENHVAPVVNLNVVYRVGSKYERPGLTGLSHVLEHMMFKSSKNLPLGEFDRRLKEVGADNNAYTWVDQTVYYETIAADQVDVALGLEAERMRGLSLTPDELAFELPVVVNELEQRDDTPMTMLYGELLAMAFKTHPYHTPTIGWRDDVESLTPEDVRAYYDTYYEPDNAFICAVGDFDPDQMFAKIQAHFGALPAAGVKLPRLPKEPEQVGERRFVIERAGQLDYLLIGWHVPASVSPDAYVLEVLGQVLGQGRTSRLYHALVDSGLCADAGSWNSAFGYQDPFLFFTNAVMNPGVDPAQVEQAIYAEIARIAAEGVTEEELARAKKQARVSFVYDKDSITAEARAIYTFELMSSWRDLDKYLPGVEAVTSADIQRVAQAYLTERNRTVGTYQAIRPADGGATGEAPEAVSAHFTPQPPMHGAPRLPAQPPVAILAAAPADSAGAGEPYASVSTLPNGLTVVIRENHDNSTVSLAGLVRAGKIDDPPGRPGTASMAVGMLLDGTAGHTKLELAELMENSGIELGFSPSREYFTFGGRSLTEDFGQLLDLLAETLTTPSFPPEEVEKARQQTLAGLMQGDQDTFDRSFYGGRDLLYGAGHPFAGRVEGTPESVQALSADDLHAWFEASVTPQDAVLVIVGDVDAQDALAQVTARLGGWSGPARDRAALLDRSREFQPVAGEREMIQLDEKSNASLLWIGPGTSKQGDDWPALTVANFTFGGDFYSRLNERLRVKEGLTYGSFSWFSNGLGAGPWCVSVQTAPENIEPAIAATVEEITRFSQDGITADELALAQNYLCGNHPVRLATNAAVASSLAEAVYLGKGVDYLATYPELVREVTAEQVDEIARQYMRPDTLALVVAGSLEGTEGEK